MDLATMEDEFVSSFSNSSTRAKLFHSFSEYLLNLRQMLEGNLSVWIDGSFITNKKNPRDIDFVSFIDWKEYESNEVAIDQLRLLRNDNNLGLDGYFVKIYSADHPKNVLYEADKIQWLYQFGRSRTDRPKGIIEINF